MDLKVRFEVGEVDVSKVSTRRSGLSKADFNKPLTNFGGAVRAHWERGEKVRRALERSDQ